jgi:putative oxidoreductase
MTNDSAKLLLRLTLGILLLFHGWSKVTGGVDFIIGVLQKSNLPGELAYLVYFGEVLASLLLLGGAYTRIAAVLVIANMVFALLLVHTGDFFALNSSGGWAIELQVFYLMSAVVIMILGPGKYSFMPPSKWN